MAKQVFLPLAEVYTPKRTIFNHYMSEKLDGMRAFWDGGATAGLLAADVPWANVAKDKKDVRCTGLWSRWGKVVHAPKWFTDNLPNFPLDLELWIDRGCFQQVMSICRSESGLGWEPVKAMILDYAPPEFVFADREIKETNFTKTLRGCLEFYQKRVSSWTFPVLPHPGSRFRIRLAFLDQQIVGCENVRLHRQQLLMPPGNIDQRLEEFKAEIYAVNGEGVILKSADGLYYTERNWNTMKVKPYLDMEVTVIGYTAGRETDKGSKLLGMMGAAICHCPKGQFKVSGFRDDERVFNRQDVAEGEVVPDDVVNPKFPRGSVITIKYRELTDEGLPKEARYYRKPT